MTSSWTARVREYAFGYLLKWASRRRAIRSALSDFGFRSRSPFTGGPVPDRIRVALVQMELKPVTSVAEYVQMIARPLEKLDQPVDLIVYPEDVATHLLGLVPDFGRLADADSVEDAVSAVAGEGIRVADVFRFLGPATRRIYRETFSSLARLTGSYIMAGTAILPEGNQVFNMAHLFGPGGRLVGTQKKLHLLPMERQWGLSTGDDISIFKSALGPLAMPVCMDATYFEAFRILDLKHVMIAGVPAANPEEYNVWKVLRGPWARAQDARLYVLHSCMVGRFAGLTITGRSAVYGPTAVTGNGTGVVAQLDDAHTPGLLVTELDMAALTAYRREHPHPVNMGLYGRYFPGIYGPEKF